MSSPCSSQPVGVRGTQHWSYHPNVPPVHSHKKSHRGEGFLAAVFSCPTDSSQHVAGRSACSYSAWALTSEARQSWAASHQTLLVHVHFFMSVKSNEEPLLLDLVSRVFAGQQAAVGTDL